MKYLTDYTEARLTALYTETGAFYAFSTKQFEEQKKEGVKYMSLGGGTICPEATAERLVAGTESLLADGIAADLAENGKAAIINRELANHEYTYTCDITDTVSALGGYGITEEEVQAETAEHLRKHYAWEEEQERKEAAREKATA